MHECDRDISKGRHVRSCESLRADHKSEVVCTERTERASKYEREQGVNKSAWVLFSLNEDEILRVHSYALVQYRLELKYYLITNKRPSE